jgi:dTDP-4-amino-4,6-dideoxygalactose transaminase
MTEIQAAFGLLQLEHMDEALSKRRAVDSRYRGHLAGVAGITLAPQDDGTVRNYAYFPIFVRPEYPLDRDALNDRLRQNGIVARRYFYPLIAEFPMYRGLPSASLDRLPVATAMSRSVLCLPIYPDLDLASVDRIAELITNP